MDQPDGPVTREEFRREIAGLEGHLMERMELMQTKIEKHTTESFRCWNSMNTGMTPVSMSRVLLEPPAA